MIDEKRYLGEASLKNEGAGDDGRPRGAGQTMREADLVKVWLEDEAPRWYVVRDRHCSHDIDDDAAAIWTLSRVPGECGWQTDSGAPGYGLRYSDASELVRAANAVKDF